MLRLHIQYFLTFFKIAFADAIFTSADLKKISSWWCLLTDEIASGHIYTPLDTFCTYTHTIPLAIYTLAT